MDDQGSVSLSILLIEDDKLWFEILFDLTKHFEYQTIDGQEVINYINERSGKDFSVFFIGS